MSRNDMVFIPGEKWDRIKREAASIKKAKTLKEAKDKAALVNNMMQVAESQ